MRDSRRARLVLALLLLTAFTLITLDYRSNGGGPFRKIGNAVFGPIEGAVSAVVDPIGSFFGGLGHLNSYKSENAKLRKQNQDLLRRLRLTDADRAHLVAADKLLNLAGRAQFKIVAARVIGFGSALGFEWTVTIDAGSDDGVQRNQTVMDGDGLVGRTVDVGPTTATVLLARDPTFTVGARLEKTQEIGTVDGAGHGPMTFTLLDAQATMQVGDRLVTFASVHDRPFVPEIPIGHVTRIIPTPGELYSKGIVTPYVDYSSLDVVGVVLAEPRTIKRDSLLPPSPTPSPTPKTGPTSKASPKASPGAAGSPSAAPSPTPSA